LAIFADGMAVAVRDDVRRRTWTAGRLPDRRAIGHHRRMIDVRGGIRPVK
jgi:hypothetical protein